MSLSNQMLRLIPPDVVPEAICLMDDIMGHMPVVSQEGLSAAVFERLESQFKGDALDKELARLHLTQMSDMKKAIYAYNILCSKFPNTRFSEERIRGESNDVTDTALFIIDSVVQKNKITDRYDIMSAVCNAVQNKYGAGDRLDVHLRRMHLKTTKDILYAIDIYFIMRKLYPDTAFGRERVREAWKDAI